MMTYTLEMADGGAYATVEITAADDAAAMAQVAGEVERWVADGSWPDDASPVRVTWTLVRTIEVGRGERVVPVMVS